jgi:hypothetical protein
MWCGRDRDIAALAPREIASFQSGRAPARKTCNFAGCTSPQRAAMSRPLSHQTFAPYSRVARPPPGTSHRTLKPPPAVGGLRIVCEVPGGGRDLLITGKGLPACTPPSKRAKNVVRQGPGHRSSLWGFAPRGIASFPAGQAGPGQGPGSGPGPRFRPGIWAGPEIPAGPGVRIPTGSCDFPVSLSHHIFGPLGEGVQGSRARFPVIGPPPGISHRTLKPPPAGGGLRVLGEVPGGAARPANAGQTCGAIGAETSQLLVGICTPRNCKFSARAPARAENLQYRGVRIPTGSRTSSGHCASRRVSYISRKLCVSDLEVSLCPRLFYSFENRQLRCEVRTTSFFSRVLQCPPRTSSQRVRNVAPR